MIIIIIKKKKKKKKFFQVDHVPNMMRKHFAFITQTIYFTTLPEVSMFTQRSEKLFVSECRRQKNSSIFSPEQIV